MFDVHGCIQFITNNLHYCYDKYSLSIISRLQPVVPFFDDKNDIVLNFNDLFNGFNCN